MRTLRQVNNKNCSHDFFNDMTNIKNLDRSLVSINQISFKSTDSVIYDINYIKNLDKYLIFSNVDAYIECNSIEENNEGKYLIFALTNKNKEALGNYTEIWNEVKDQIEMIRDSKPKLNDFMKIKFESDDDLPLGKLLNIALCVTIVRSVFSKKQ